MPDNVVVQLDDINADLKSRDLAPAIGAGDGVNPAARSDKASPVVEPLFCRNHFSMVCGDAQAACIETSEMGRDLGASRRRRAGVYFIGFGERGVEPRAAPREK